MKNLYLPSLAVGILLSSCNPSKNQSYLEKQYIHAMEYKDYPTAIYYLHELKEVAPDDYTIYQRLGDHYLQTYNYHGAALALKQASKGATELEKKTISQDQVKAYKGLGERDKAIEKLQSLCAMDKENEIEYLYEIAVLLFEKKELPQALENMEKVLKHTDARNKSKQISSDLGIDEVNYYIAALNFKGYIKTAKGELEEAEELFQKIFEINKNFKLAINNYKLLQQQKYLRDQQAKQEK